MSPDKQATARARRIPTGIRKQLLIVAGMAVLVASASVAVVYWDQLIGLPPERVIRVYWIHGCGCMRPWVASLEASGFTVRATESETLSYVRSRLHMPKGLHGCHVGEYLGYFVEGHVEGDALRRLAKDHPQAIGVVTQPIAELTIGHPNRIKDEHSPVLLVDLEGHFLPWIETDVHVTHHDDIDSLRRQ